MIPTRLCLIQYLDGDDIGVVTVGWHRVDGPDFAHGQDDGQDHQRLAAARREADLPETVPVSIMFADVDVPAAAFTADLGAEPLGQPSDAPAAS
jgi:hypothetical protein